MRLREHIAAVLAVVLLLVSAGASSCQASCGLRQMGMAGRAQHACHAGAAGGHAMAGMQAVAGHAAMAMLAVGRAEGASACGDRVCVQPVQMQVGKVGPGGADSWVPWQAARTEPLLFADQVLEARQFVCLPVARSCLVRSLQSQMRV